MKPVHQIWHGDSRALCQRFQAKKMVNCVITDPPFGVNNQSNMAKTVSGKEYARKIANDESPEQAIAVFQAVMDALLPGTTDEADMYIFTAHQVLAEWLEVADSLRRHGFKRSAILVWEKDGPGMGNLDSWGMGMEFVLFLKKGNRARSDTRRNGVLRVPQVRPDKLIHPHEKPTPLLELFLKHSTDEGDFAVDPFGGSGSLVRAAKNCNRNAVAIEYDEKNFKLASDALATAADTIW